MPRAVTITVLCAALVTACSSSSGGHGRARPTASIGSGAWPMLGHDLSSTFHEPRAGLTTRDATRLRVAWRYDAGAAVTGAPAVVGDRVYVLSQDGLAALDARDGHEVWRRPDVTGTSSPTVAAGVVYVLGSRPVLWALDARTGRNRWHVVADPQPLATGFSSPVVAGHLVIVGNASINEVTAKERATFRGSVAAFERGTGREVWRRPTADPPANGAAVWSTVSVDPAVGLVYAGTGNNYTEVTGPTSDAIFALDVHTGAVRWARQVSGGDLFTVPNPHSADSDFGTNPILFDATVGGRLRHLLGAGQKSGLFSVLDRETGAIVWQRRVSGGTPYIGGIFNNGAYDGSRIVVSGNTGTSNAPGSEPSNGRSKPAGGTYPTTAVLAALDPASGRVLWERQLPAWTWAPITLGAHVGFVTADDTVEAFDPTNGRRLFSFTAAGTISSAPVLVGRRVYFGSGVPYFTTKDAHTVYALEPRQ